MAPKVESLADIMAQLDPAYQGQRDVYSKQSGQIDVDTQNTITGLKAQRGEAWNDIGRSANARGFAFGGIRADEQARYDSTAFMPAVAKTQSEGIKAKNDISLASAQLSTDARKTALGMQQQQQSNLNSWNMQEASLAAQARENQLNRGFQASQAAASRAASQVNVFDTIESMLQNSMGSDRKVSPAAWEQAAAYASRNGLKFQGSDGFASKFWQYANGNHWQDYLGKRYNDKY